jgi:ferredoxin
LAYKIKNIKATWVTQAKKEYSMLVEDFSMPQITFKNLNKTIEVQAGTSLQDAVDDHQITFSFGCRMGSCGVNRYSLF